MTWAICHKSGTVLFTTSDERTMLNRKSHGWVIKMNTISKERERAEPVSPVVKHINDPYADPDFDEPPA